MNDELQHYGILGMKWGRRKVRGHAGPGKYMTRKRQLAGDRRDLEAINKGAHLSVGFTKKRQEAFDKRDRTAIEKRIAKNENHFKEQAAKKEVRSQEKQSKREFKKQINQEKYEKMVADNDRRVEKYGKTAVKISNTARIVTTAMGMKVGMDLVKSIGKSSVKAIADNPNMGTAALHTASILSVGGMGAIAVSSMKRMKALGADNRLANQYEARQYLKNQAKNKK